MRPDTIICSNTSSLSLEELASALERPQRFVGLHFFNPVNRMPLVEVVPWRGASQEVVVSCAELVRRIGKTPIVVGDCAGFLVNRILLPYLIESAWMFEEGTRTQRVDRLLERDEKSSDSTVDSALQEIRQELANLTANISNIQSGAAQAARSAPTSSAPPPAPSGAGQGGASKSGSSSGIGGLAHSI